jgi:hypothetical protein
VARKKLLRVKASATTCRAPARAVICRGFSACAILILAAEMVRRTGKPRNSVAHCGAVQFAIFNLQFPSSLDLIHG